MTKLQEKLATEKTKNNKLILENATTINKLKSAERENSELKVKGQNQKLEIEDI